MKLYRNYGYDVLINNFEYTLREYLLNDIFILNFTTDWSDHIPNGIFQEICERKEWDCKDVSINDFFEELNFPHLKDIIIFKNNYNFFKLFLSDLSKEKFIEIMDDLYTYRNKIAHAKSNFTEYDLGLLICSLRIICKGEAANEIIQYLDNEGYKNAKDIPITFLKDFSCQNNLPSETYDLDGGFVGRDRELRALRKMILSNQDRIITIIGSGGVGKTAIALKIGYSFLEEPNNPFDAIIWFSAKINKLTDEGIIPIPSQIRNDIQFVQDILKILDFETLQKFELAKVPFDSYKHYLYEIFSSQKCLLIIDNLETISMDTIIEFIKDIPRPSQVLITSRKGLGEIERRYPISDMLEKDAITLFRLIAKERNKQDLLRLKTETISDFVKRVKCYPLLIKWSIGQICLGRDVNTVFSKILPGDSEIAIFIFNDVFDLLSKTSQSILYSMIIFGEKPASKFILMHLINTEDDELFNDAIKELMVTSFVFSTTLELPEGVITEFSMLELTRGFIEVRLDEDETEKHNLLTRYYHLSEQLQEFERSKSSYFQSPFSLGIKTSEEKVAFNYVKTAKNYEANDDNDLASENYEQAIKIAPNFSYALAEYSKFEWKRQHHHHALELAQQAIEGNPKNFHPWFNYGIMLRRAKKYPESVINLIQAKGLNPSYLPIYNELGLTYKLQGEHEKAEKEFQEALKQEKYPNIRHIIITMQFLADNYRDWAVDYANRKDVEGQIGMLRKAHDKILDAVNIAKDNLIPDNRLWLTYRRIFKDLGVALSQYEGFDSGKPYLEKCLNTIEFGRFKMTPDNEISAEVCFYMAAFMLNENKKDHSEILSVIEEGLSYTKPNSKQFTKLNDLKFQLEAAHYYHKKDKSRIFGFIQYFNKIRKFGIIENMNGNHIFFLSGFRERVDPETINILNGEKVSFISVENPEKPTLPIAQDIIYY